MPKGIPLTTQKFEQRRREIAEAAADLILSQGFNETSVLKISKAAGIGKSTLYDFFASKEEILLFLLEDPLVDLTERTWKIIQNEGSPEDRLRQVMDMHLNFLLEKKAYYLKLSLEAQRLSVESQRHYQVMRYAYQDLVQGLIEEGIAQGSFRLVNPAMAMKSLLAMMTPVVFTTRPVGTSDEMLGDALDIFFGGITK
jgi:AcrR family transcriptional regulator